MIATNATNPLTLRGGMQLKDYIGVIMRRRWIIIIALLSVVASTVFYVTRIEDVFESSSTIVIEEQTTLIDQAMNFGSTQSLSYYQGILNSRTYLEMVFDSIGMNVFAATFPKITRDEAISYIQGSFSLKPTSYTSFYRFNAQAKTRELAYLIASIGTDAFRLQCQEVASEQTRRTVSEIDKQLQTIRKKLEQAEVDFRSYKERTGDVSGGTTPELKTLQSVYSENMAQLGVKEADLDAENKQLALLERKLTPLEQERSPEYLKLRSKLSELEKEKMRLENLGIKLTGISTIDREVAEIEKQLLQYKQPEGAQTIDTRIVKQWQELRKIVLSKEGDLELFKRKLDSYKSAIASYKKGNPDLLTQSLELQRLERTRQIYETIYNFLLNKAEEERIKSSATSAGIKVVDIPRIAGSPIPKNQNRFYLIGILVGLALGLLLAFFAEYNDSTIKSNEDVERYLGLSVLGTIPHIVHDKKNEMEIKRTSSRKQKGISVLAYPKQLLNFAGEDSIITEAYRSLRTNLAYISPDKPLQAVLLTSAGPSEGKSLSISNLALAHAQMGKRTLLIDTDLRRPIQHHLFGLKREPGFTEMFVEKPDYASIIRPTGRENLWIITAGIFSPNPAELIGSQRMAEHIAYFRKNFDMIFFDTPPAVAVTDAALLSTHIDGIILVVKSHHTDREVAQRAVQSLRNVGAKLTGAILNDIDLTHRYTSYGYYKYYYHYYKSKTD